MSRAVMFISLLFFCLSNTRATPLYLDLLDSANPDKKELERARKQINEYIDMKIKDGLFIAPFHKRRKQGFTEMKSVCSLCHFQLPHRKNERSRSFLNMHSRYIACETCHLKSTGYALEYRWLDFKYKEKRTLPADNEKDDNEEKSIQLNPGMRITPYYSGEPVIIFNNHDYAKKLKKTWAEASSESRIKIKAKLHNIINKDGTKCKSCHDKKNQLLDYSMLGVTERQLKLIEKNIIAKFFTRFKKDSEKIRITNILR